MALLLLVAFVLAGVSLGTAWWSYSASASGGTTTVDFLPGSNYAVTCAGSTCGGFSSGSFPYAALGGSLGSVYGTVLVLVALSVAFAGFAALFGGLGALGRDLGAWQRPGIPLLGVAAVALLLSALVWVVSAQPGAFLSNDPLTGSSAGGSSPAGSFWGSNAAGTVSWGAGLGWYLGLASALLLCAVAVLTLVLGRDRLAVPDHRARSARSSVMFAPRAYPLAPVATPLAGPVPARPTAWTPPPTSAPAAPSAPVGAVESAAMLPCPACGTENLARSRVCSYCQRPLR